VLAALLASLKETDEGSFRNAVAVLNAACFWAKDVPSVGASGLGEEEDVSREKRDWSSLTWAELLRDAGGGGDGLGVESRAGGGTAGLLFPPTPKPGTDTPAAPNLLNAPWFKIPRLGSASDVAAPYVGGGEGAEGEGFEFCLGGNRGGRPGGFALAAGGAIGGLLPSAPSFLPGGGGRCDVDSPVLSARYGTGGGGGFFASSSRLLASASSASCCALISLAGIGAPHPLVSGVV
jgi:hypothetical protein